MPKSTNYNLQLDSQEDYYDIDMHNGNYQIIDAALKGLEDTKASKIYTDVELSKKINTIGNQTLYGSIQFSHGTEINSSSEVSFGCADKIGAKILSKRTNVNYIGNEGNLEFYTQVGSVTNTQPLKRMEIENNGNINMWGPLKIKKNSISALEVANENNNQIFAVDTINQVLTGLAADKKADKTFVLTKIAELVDSSPAALDTLNELAAALGDNPNFATTISNLIGTKANATDMATALATKVNNSDVATTQTADKVVKRDANKEIAGVLNLDGEKVVRINSQNLNLLVKTGFYYCTNYTNGAPGITEACYVLVYQALANYYMQQLVTLSGKKYIRFCVNSVWTAWTQENSSIRKLIADSTIVRSTWTYFDIEKVPQKLKIVLYGSFVGAVIDTDIIISEAMSNTTFEVEMYDDGGTLRIRPFVNVNTGDEVYVKFTETQFGIKTNLNVANQRVIIISEKF